MDSMSGLLLVDKPPGPTSHDVVQVLRRKLGVRRIGHAGTLDPMAQGLLVTLIAGATKQQQLLQGHDKIYEAVLRLGVQTNTGDAMGESVRAEPVPPIDCQRAGAVMHSLTGTMMQTPPAFSALKVKGRPAYWWARRKQPVVLKPRPVNILALDLLEWACDSVAFRVHCSAGTYVRSLAEVMAQRLGTVGHLSRLTRLAVGPLRLEQAHPLQRIVEMSPDVLMKNLIALPLQQAHSLS